MLMCGSCLCRNVNQKALDQYVNFTEQREELKRRQTENTRGEVKIKQLIDVLDMRKDEAIERTFKAGHYLYQCHHDANMLLACPKSLLFLMLTTPRDST